MAKSRSSRKKVSSKKVSPIPKGYHSVIPSITVKNAEQAIEFYKKAFGAKEKGKFYMPNTRTILHAELRIGDSAVMLNDEMPEMKALSPPSVGGPSSSLYVFVNNVDKVFDQAVRAGATPAMPVMDVFWGDRMGQLVDPYGHVWMLATHKKDLSKKQVEKAGAEFFASMQKQ
ncbi:MAG TPA: VOC family protein [Nitrososphaera sp.]|jgi:uncharacterized glyoxalase superfamily protein PhnB